MLASTLKGIKVFYTHDNLGCCGDYLNSNNATYFTKCIFWMFLSNGGSHLMREHKITWLTSGLLHLLKWKRNKMQPNVPHQCFLFATAYIVYITAMILYTLRSLKIWNFSHFSVLMIFPCSLAALQNLLFNWTPMGCTSFVFGVGSIVNFVCSLFSQPIPWGLPRATRSSGKETLWPIDKWDLTKSHPFNRGV